jgi:regulatory protein
VIITGIRSQRRHPERASLHVDGEFVCGVAWEVVLAEGLRAGDELSDEVLARVQLGDEKWRAKQAALSLLATRARARRELLDRLRGKQFSAATAEWAVAESARLGLVDDAAFADAWVRDRLRLRPRGSRALIAELTRKGVDPETARAAVAGVMEAEGTDDAALCMHAAEKWLKTHGARAGADADERRRTERRLAAYLARRGCDGADVRAAIEYARRRFRA